MPGPNGRRDARREVIIAHNWLDWLVASAFAKATADKAVDKSLPAHGPGIRARFTPRQRAKVRRRNCEVSFARSLIWTPPRPFDGAVAAPREGRADGGLDAHGDTVSPCYTSVKRVFHFFCGGGGALRLALQIRFAERMTGKEIGVNSCRGPCAFASAVSRRNSPEWSSQGLPSISSGLCLRKSPSLEAMGVHPPARFLAGLGQCLEKIPPIDIVQEDFRRAVSPAQDARPAVASAEADGTSLRDIGCAPDGAWADSAKDRSQPSRPIKVEA
jgi:hypothetical protein